MHKLNIKYKFQYANSRHTLMSWQHLGQSTREEHPVYWGHNRGLGPLTPINVITGPLLLIVKDMPPPLMEQLCQRVNLQSVHCRITLYEGRGKKIL